MTEKKLSSALLLIFVISLVAAFVLGAEITNAQSFRMELIKSLLQLAIVVVMGGVIAALFKQYDVTRSKLLDHESQLNDIAETKRGVYESYSLELGRLYRLVKRVRRTLRAAGLSTITQNDDAEITTDQMKIYRNEMATLNETQLELEGMKIESKYVKVFQEVSVITNRLGLMEDYLRRILAEYEAVARLKSLKLTQLKRLDEFTGDSRRTDLSFSGELGFSEEEGKPTDYTLLASFWTPYEEIVANLNDLRFSQRM